MRFRPILGSVWRSRNVGLLTLTSLIAAFVAFIVNIVTARVLGPDGRGAVALVLQIAYIAAPLSVFGFPRAKLRAGTGGREIVGGGRSWLLLTLVLIAPAVAWLFGTWYLLAIPAAAVAASFQVMRSNAIVDGNYRRYFRLFVLYQSSILLGTSALALLEVSAWQFWATTYFVPSFLVVLFSFGGFRWELNPLIWMRENWPYAGAEFSSILVLRFDRLAIGYFSGSGALGLYVVVATALEPIYWVAQSVADSRTVSEYRTGGLARLSLKLFRDAVVYGGAGAVGGLVIWFAIVPVFGQEYEEARSLVVPLTIATILLVLYRQAAGMALVRGRLRRLGVSESALSIIAVVTYASLTFGFGALGAAWASCFVYFVGFILLLWVTFTSGYQSE